MGFTALIMIVYVVIIRPQKDLIMVVLTAVGEAMILVLHIISIAFLDDSLPEAKSTKIGWFVIMLVGFYILVNWLIIMAFTAVDLVK